MTSNMVLKFGFSDIIQKHIKKLIVALVVIILIAWLVHASFLYGLKDLYFGSDKDSKRPQNLKVNKEIIFEDSLTEDSSYDSILEYLVTDDYDSQENLMKSNDFAGDLRQNVRYGEFQDDQSSNAP